MNDLSRSEKVARMWFLLCETPVLTLALFCCLFGSRAVFAYSDSLPLIHTICLTALFVTSVGILLFEDHGRWVGFIGLATIVVAVLTGCPLLAV